MTKVICQQSLNDFFYKNFMAPFYVYMVFNCLKAAEPLLGDSLLLTTKSPGVPDTHLIDHMHLTDNHHDMWHCFKNEIFRKQQK